MCSGTLQGKKEQSKRIAATDKRHEDSRGLPYSIRRVLIIDTLRCTTAFLAQSVDVMAQCADAIS
jgi:hypothetical protein